MPLEDSSGYVPSQAKSYELNKTLSYWAAGVNPDDRIALPARKVDKARVWELSLEDVQEIEEAVQVFEGLYTCTISRSRSANFVIRRDKISSQEY